MEVDASTPVSCLSVKISRDQLIKVVALRWVIATPLGFPVEPEV